MQPTENTYSPHQPSKTGYRKLDIDIKRPSASLTHFWWSTGIAIAVLFLIIVLAAYLQYKK